MTHLPTSPNKANLPSSPSGNTGSLPAVPGEGRLPTAATPTYIFDIDSLTEEVHQWMMKELLPSVGITEENVTEACKDPQSSHYPRISRMIDLHVRRYVTEKHPEVRPDAVGVLTDRMYTRIFENPEN